MRVALSIRAGKISSATLLRRLGNESRKNRIYRALREVGRAVRSVVLLRYLSEPELREGITAITNRVEAFHGFAKWLSFGHDGILTGNDPRPPREDRQVQRAPRELRDLLHHPGHHRGRQ
jgi:TnpA family transposase